MTTNDEFDLEAARRLVQAIRDEPFCDDPTCCPPEEDHPVTNPNPALTTLKLIAAIYIPAVLLALGLLLALGKVFG